MSVTVSGCDGKRQGAVTPCDDNVNFLNFQTLGSGQGLKSDSEIPLQHALPESAPPFRPLPNAFSLGRCIAKLVCKKNIMQVVK